MSSVVDAFGSFKPRLSQALVPVTEGQEVFHKSEVSHNGQGVSASGLNLSGPGQDLRGLFLQFVDFDGFDAVCLGSALQA
jgi:hypothetical protein